MTDDFFGSGSRGFSSAERIARSIEISAVNAARAYSGIVSVTGQVSDILQSAAANSINAANVIGAIFGNGNTGGGGLVSANRKWIDRDISAKKLPYDFGITGISGGIIFALQYAAALETAQNAGLGTLGTLGLLGIAVNEFRDNTGGAYEITLSFGGLLGGTIAVALAALGNSVIWLRKLCADSILEIGNSAMALAAFFGGMWNEPLSLAVMQFLWFGSSALSVIGSVISAVGSITANALPISVTGVSPKSTVGSLGGLSGNLFGENFPIIGNILYNGAASIVNSASSVISTQNSRSLSSILFGGNSSIFGGGLFNIISSVVNSASGGKSLVSNENNRSLSSMLFGGNSSIFENSFFNSMFPFLRGNNNVFSNEYIRYDRAFAAGYLIGDILMRSVGIAGSGSANSEKIASDVSKITENTAKSSAASEISTDDLRFLCDIAARDVINRFTTAQVSVSMGGVTNNLSGTADLDGIIDYLANGVKTAMENAAEGVHS